VYLQIDRFNAIDKRAGARRRRPIVRQLAVALAGRSAPVSTVPCVLAATSSLCCCSGARAAGVERIARAGALRDPRRALGAFQFSAGASSPKVRKRC